MGIYQVSFIREDGVTGDTSYKGWNAETAAHAELNALKQNQRVLYACILQGHDREKLSLRTAYIREKQ